MDTAAFLKTVVTTEEGWFNLALKSSTEDKEWTQLWYEWPKDIDTIVNDALEQSKQNNVYFSAHLFNSKNAYKTNVLPSKTIQADLDNAILLNQVQPTVLVETSPNRHQGFYILGNDEEPEDLEALSKQLTYGIPDSDHSGWSLGHKMRLPGTINYKYVNPNVVKVISALVGHKVTIRKSNLLVVDGLPEEDEFEPASLEKGPRQLWTEVKSLVPRKVALQYDRRAEDRSVALFNLIAALVRAGVDRDRIHAIAWESANNKFRDNKYHGSLDLSKDILRIERKVLSPTTTPDDIKSKILEARHLPGIQAEKRAYIAHIVREHMAQQGSFVESNTGEEWFVREDTGRPILLSRGSEHLASLLEMKYGLNATEPEQRYTINLLISNTKERGRRGHVASLSYYDKAAQSVMIHTGRREVFRIDEKGSTILSNGNLNVIFPWRNNEEPFDPDLENPLPIDMLFEGCFNNLNEMPPQQAMALIKAWLYFLFFRDDATGRPILALFGQPGSGKSTLFRRVYTLLYGATKAVNSITTADDFDFAVASDPLVVFDNVDTWTSWLPDKLALSASTSDLVKRKLFTDTDTVTLKRQALVGITAHNPKFRREDIVDRLLILSLHRLERFLPETDLLREIYMKRDQLWGGIIKDITTILKTPQPHESELPRFRVSDFSRIGLWVARALGFEEDFKTAIMQNSKEQTTFNLEEEDILIDTIKIWMTRNFYEPEKYYPVSVLWTAWQSVSRDPANFTRQYRNAIVLGKKLWTLQETLSSVFNISFEFDPQGTRSWRLQPR